MSKQWSEMETIWIIYPYESIKDEQFAESRHNRIGRALSENGYNVVLWTANFSHVFKKRRSKGWKQITNNVNFCTILVPSTSYQKNISVRRILFEVCYSHSLNRAFMKAKKPDLIITSGTGLITSFYPIWPYIKENNIPVIYDIMDIHLFSSYMELHHRLFTPFARLIARIIEQRERPFFERVNAVCGLGKNQLEIARKRTGRDVPACLVYNSVDVASFRAKMEMPCNVKLPQKKNGEIWCVYAGSLGPSYDIKTIIACARLSKENRIIKYIIIGAGPQRNMVIDASKDVDSILFLDSVGVDLLPAIYRRCDIGLCTYSSYSTVDMPDKFYDYTAAGLAIVSSLRGEIMEYVNTVGGQYEAENPQSLKESIEKVCRDLDAYKTESYLLADKFDFQKQMRSMVDFVNSQLCETKETESNSK